MIKIGEINNYTFYKSNYPTKENFHSKIFQIPWIGIFHANSKPSIEQFLNFIKPL